MRFKANYLEKNAWLPLFYFMDSNSPCRDLLFPRGPNPAQKPLYLVGTVLKKHENMKTLNRSKLCDLFGLSLSVQTVLPSSAVQTSGKSATPSATPSDTPSAALPPSASRSSVNTASTSPVETYVSTTLPVQPSSTSSPSSSSGMCSQMSFTIANFAKIPWGIHMHTMVVDSIRGPSFTFLLFHVTFPPAHHPCPTTIISICTSATVSFDIDRKLYIS